MSDDKERYTIFSQDIYESYDIINNVTDRALVVNIIDNHQMKMKKFQFDLNKLWDGNQESVNIKYVNKSN